MNILSLLQGVEIFAGLTEAELGQLLSICREAHYHKGDVLTKQGQPGNDLFIIQDGLLEVRVGTPLGTSGPEADLPPQVVINLGAGQVVGEMALVDGGPRSATVRCVTATAAVSVIDRAAFEQLCQTHQRIGLIIYRNLAADLSFKLRHQNLLRR